MQGKTHVASGWVVGLAVAPLFGLHTIETVVPFAATCAGWALAPDLDHPQAKVSRLFGPVTNAMSHVVRFASARIYQATKGPRDEDWTGKHRHLTHCALAAALLGVLAGWGTSAGGPWAVAAVCALGLLLAVDGLGRGGVGELLTFGVLGAGVVWWSTVGGLGVLTAVQGWIGWAVFLGCLAHQLGDACTVSGVPILFPLPIAGENWFEVKLLGPFSLHTGHWAERNIAFPAFIVAGVLLVPGVWPVVADAVRVGWSSWLAAR